MNEKRLPNTGSPFYKKHLFLIENISYSKRQSPGAEYGVIGLEILCWARRIKGEFRICLIKILTAGIVTGRWQTKKRLILEGTIGHQVIVSPLFIDKVEEVGKICANLQRMSL